MAMSLFAIVGIAMACEGRPIPRLPYSISINTLVAIYIFAMKASMLLITSNGLGQLKWTWFSGPVFRPLAQMGRFDDASRGMAGAFTLLWMLRLVPSVGAVVMILTTVLDPFGYVTIIDLPSEPGAKRYGS